MSEEGKSEKVETSMQVEGGGPWYAAENQAPCRHPSTRPSYKLSVNLIDTYKHINKIYYENKAKKKLEDQEGRGGVHNSGYDDQHYDYILKFDELVNDRYMLKQKIGKGSFGQVVSAYDVQEKCEVAIKIIKSRRPFTLQAQSEISLLNLMLEKDKEDDCNVVRMTQQFMFRNHQCIVFEMLSYNLYDLLRNTKFNGVSLNLVRKFAKQILRTLEFFHREDVDVIHCDLKPENILLKHPRRSGIKIIDLGSSCFATKRTYTYIQSRFYRSPEILLGLAYDQKIDMWSLGCLLVEMHTGEPLFSGSNQPDQICKIVDILGMPPTSLLEQSESSIRGQFFDRVERSGPSGTLLTPMADDCDKRFTIDGTFTNNSEIKHCSYILRRPVGKTTPTPAADSEAERHVGKKLRDIIGVETGGPYGRRQGEPGHTPEKYEEFLDLIKHMLVFDPKLRISAKDALNHPYLLPEGSVMAAAGSFAVGNGNTSGGSLTIDTTATSNVHASLSLTDQYKSKKNHEINGMEVDHSEGLAGVKQPRPSSAGSGSGGKNSLSAKLRCTVQGAGATVATSAGTGNVTVDEDMVVDRV